MDYRMNIGFIGGGNMAEALISGILKAGILPADKILVSELRSERRDHLIVHHGVKPYADNKEMVRLAGTLFLAVKPQVVPDVLAEIGPLVAARHLVVSIAAGITLARLEKALPKSPVIRAMPNTPALIGCAATVIAPGRLANAEMAGWTRRIFESVGICLILPERHLDAVTGLSGSGPAYVFLMAEALADGGVLMGLPREESSRLAQQTIFGAARMMLETGQHPGALKDAVASPGGTTIEGIRALEETGFRAAVIRAVEKAAQRSKALGGE